MSPIRDGSATELDGLDRLVMHISSSGRTEGWFRWYSASLVQLESDDAWDPRLSDLMVEVLTQAEAAYRDGTDQEEHLAYLVELYLKGREEALLVARLRQQAEELRNEELYTETWLDFQEALDCVAHGDRESAEEWLYEMEEVFQTVWEDCQKFERVGTLETIAVQVALRDGVGYWLDALKLFRRGLSDFSVHREVQAKAKKGQALLVIVKRIEDDSTLAQLANLGHGS